MSGTKAGGIKAAATIKEKHGEDFYARIGRKGGRNGHTGGFAANPALARVAGAKGGKISKRGPAKRNYQGEAIRKDGEKCEYHAKEYGKAKKTDDDAVPDHGEQEKIGIWQRIYRSGKTVVKDEK